MGGKKEIYNQDVRFFHRAIQLHYCHWC